MCVLRSCPDHLLLQQWPRWATCKQSEHKGGREVHSRRCHVVAAVTKRQHKNKSKPWQLSISKQTDLISI